VVGVGGEKRRGRRGSGFGGRWSGREGRRKKKEGAAVAKLKSFRELRVYQELRKLHLEVHELSMGFPPFEKYELGTQIRRSSNSAPAQVAEGWGSRHTNMYIEAINRALGEIRETQHHLDIACEKGYLTADRFAAMDDRYDHCGRMLQRLHQALGRWAGTTRTGDRVSEQEAAYSRRNGPEWEDVAELTEEIMDKPS
jgi:four helix bundle protein